MNDLEAEYRYYECVIRLHELEYDFEIRGNGQNYTKGEHGRFTGSKPAGEKNFRKGIDKAKKNGIMKIGCEAPMNTLTRKKKSPEYIEPMPKKQLQRIVKSFKAQGGIILMNDSIDEYLTSKQAEAITYDSKTILLKQHPSRASVFEELIHTAQYRTGKNNGSYESRLKCEIAAQKKLIKYSKVYKLTDIEIYQTKQALESYTKELNDYYINGGV